MSENTPEQPTPAPSPADDGGKRYAAYDTTYLKFVDGVFTTKKAAGENAKKAGVKKFEVREV